MPVGDWLPGSQRRLRKAVDALTAEFAESRPTGDRLDRAASAYRDAIRAAVPSDPRLARTLVEKYDHRLPAGAYPFRSADEGWLLDQARRDDVDALTVVFEIGSRVPLPQPQRAARDRLVTMLGPAGDADALVSHLRRWRDAAQLDSATLTAALRGHLGRAPLDRDGALWKAFLDDLPEPMLPMLFEVHRFLGRGADAVRLADSPGAKKRAVECCLASARPGDVRAGIELARRTDPGSVARLQERLGDLLLAADDVEDALDAFRDAGRADLASRCLERLGRFREALAGCPADAPETIARLAGHCVAEVDGLVGQGEFEAAAHLVQTLKVKLETATPADSAVAGRLAEVTALRDAVLAAGRKALRHKGDLAAWSRFEEAAGDLAAAARLAEQGGDTYRGHRLFRQAERFGDADRVLRDDTSEEGIAARAVARRDGGDLIGAARLYRQQREETVLAPANAALDVAVLRAEWIHSGLSLGHAELVGVGDRVHADGESGLVDRLESFPEQGLRLFRVGMRMPSSAGGGPLLNDLGEVVGVLEVGDRPGDSTYALTVDAVAELLGGP